jgi:hypothetical protein
MKTNPTATRAEPHPSRPRGATLPLALAALAFGLGVFTASWPELAEAHPIVASPAAGDDAADGEETSAWQLPPGHPPVDCELPPGHPPVDGDGRLPPGHPPVGDDALPPGHPSVTGSLWLPPGHPPVGATRELPPGHPPVAGSPRHLPAGHPPVGARPPPPLLFPQERMITL